MWIVMAYSTCNPTVSSGSGSKATKTNDGYVYAFF